jgi:hypothetical protein
MQDRPNKLVLLTAIARFLNEEARPALGDPRLAFRALIAANLASIVASEMMTDDEHLVGELTRLRAIVARLRDTLPSAESEPIPARTDERREQVAQLNARVAELLRTDAASSDDVVRITAHLRQTLKDKLSVDNPRFDTSLVIE